MILVTGATGSNGSAIVAELAQRGIAARAMVRRPDRAELPDGIDAVAGDFDDADSLARALDGVERAFLVTPSSEQAEAQQRRFVAAARAAGVRHVVKLSQLAADADSPVRFLRYHAAVEAALRASGMTWTFLRPNLFMQGLLQLAPMVRATGMLAAPIGEAPVSVIDVRDIADAAVAALTEEGHAGQTYTLTGPAALSHAALAAALTQAAARDIAFVRASDEQMRGALAAAGMPAWQVEGVIEDYAHYARGEAAAVTDDVARATGHPPRDFAAFAREHASAFRADDA